MTSNSNSIRNLLAQAAERFQREGIENPRFAAEMILRHILSLKRIDLILDPDRMVNSPDVAEFELVVRRKLNREPLQYILGETEWFGLKIKCDPRALIPRPETEVVVERALHHIDRIANPQVLDLGTGTGCIAIAIATSRPDASVVATDISPESLTLAIENVSMHQLQQRISLLTSDVFASIELETQFDLIISNAPYIPSADYLTLMPEVRDYEPATALVAGDDGLDIIRGIIATAPLHLKSERFLVMEFGMGQAAAITQLAMDQGQFALMEIIQDYNQIDRGIVLQKLS